jgi:hypothetical protein
MIGTEPDGTNPNTSANQAVKAHHISQPKNTQPQNHAALKQQEPS